jgi:hypothetical protein
MEQQYFISLKNPTGTYSRGTNSYPFSIANSYSTRPGFYELIPSYNVDFFDMMLNAALERRLAEIELENIQKRLKNRK